MNDAMGSHESPPAGGEAAGLATIVRIAAQKGFAHYAQRLGLWARSETDEAVHKEGDARALRETLEELGPTFVKFGQMLSQRPDIFPASLVNELRALHDRATRFSPKRRAASSRKTRAARLAKLSRSSTTSRSPPLTWRRCIARRCRTGRASS